MLEVAQLLESYVEGVQRLTGAEGASLFVPAPPGSRTGALLLHSGGSLPLEELAEAEAAAEFVARQGQRSDTAQRSPASVELVEASGGHGVLIPLPTGRPLSSADGSVAAEPHYGRRRGDDGEAEAPGTPVAWLGLRFATEQAAGQRWDPHRPVDLAAGEDPQDWWRWLFSIGSVLAAHSLQISAVLSDSVTGLPNRSGFQTRLDEELEDARRNATSLSLLLVNPDGFATINERFGREAGDEIVGEISQRLRNSLRTSDTVSRFGGVIFAVTLVDTSLEVATRLALKLQSRLSEGAYLDGAVRLGFSLGIATFDGEDADLRSPLDLIRRADQALNSAKRQGGGQVADWERGVGNEERANFDRLSGVFTGNMSKDYRNMVLLSDAIDVIAVNREFEGLAAEVVGKLWETLQPDRVALFVSSEDNEPTLLRGVTRLRQTEATRQSRVETVELPAESVALIRAATESGEPQQRLLPGDEVECTAIPLMVSEGPIGCLYLDGRHEALRLERSDVIFLRALASQLAVALDRARLAELERRHRELERRELRAELNELRQAVQQSRMVYRSAEMEDVVARARRVAPTEATVLIMGESGTGKELLARTLHELSLRRKKPLVVVDCGSISSSLIESELFGHERGAFTGAQQRRRGRLAEAADGTVLLDEIGELPLEVQSKLLRFVQEKQFTAVGGTRPQRVDVRILAATNRDLASEVEAGRFREDLYYRLNVVQLAVPPLRERRDDVLHLARHFLETYVIQYQKNLRLTPEAEEALVGHSWPGNVRELQNRMMQAVILCEGDQLGCAELKLGGRAVAVRRASSAAVSHTAVGGAASDEGPVAPRPWEDLRQALRRQVEAVARTGPGTALPLGRWLSEDLVREASLSEDGSSRGAARRLGLAATTYRRRFQKAQENSVAGLDARSDAWHEVREALAAVLGLQDEGGANLIQRASRLLLEEILEQYPSDPRTGAVLLGVSQPTYRLRLGERAVAAEVEPVEST